MQLHALSSRHAQQSLHKGDIVLCGFEYGRVRAMRNELGQEVLEAGPSIPVEILGLSGVPAAGDEVHFVTGSRHTGQTEDFHWNGRTCFQHFLTQFVTHRTNTTVFETTQDDIAFMQ